MVALPGVARAPKTPVWTELRADLRPLRLPIDALRNHDCSVMLHCDRGETVRYQHDEFDKSLISNDWCSAHRLYIISVINILTRCEAHFAR